MNKCFKKGISLSVLMLATLTLTAGCASNEEFKTPKPIPGYPGMVEGYLAPKDVPSSLLLIPPAPIPGEAAYTYDEEIAKRSFKLRDTKRWTLAISDADLNFSHASKTYSCALGIDINPQDTPHLYTLLHRSATDAGISTLSAKKHYKRTRPFVYNGQPVCTPNEMDQLEHDGSYPSGHTTVGWGWALILAEASPDQANAILKRGREFGESRNVCNVHWHSDVEQGRVIAAGAVARLHASPEFRAELEAAKAEIIAARAKGVKPTRDCAAEAEALAVEPAIGQ